MFRKQWLAVLLAAFTLSACGFPKTFYELNPEYEGEKRFNVSLMVLPLTEDIVEDAEWNDYLVNSSGSAGIVNAQNKQTYYRYFGLAVKDVSTATVSDLTESLPVNKPDQTSFKPVVLKEKKDRKFTMLLPESGRITHEGQSSDYALFIEGLSWTVGYKEESGQAIGRSAISTIVVNIQLKYALWDNQNERVAAFGRVTEKHEILEVPSKATYIEYLENIARGIIVNSPIQDT
jgi:hypothetical protein